MVFVITKDKGSRFLIRDVCEAKKLKYELFELYSEALILSKNADLIFVDLNGPKNYAGDKDYITLLREACETPIILLYSPDEEQIANGYIANKKANDSLVIPIKFHKLEEIISKFITEKKS